MNVGCVERATVSLYLGIFKIIMYKYTCSISYSSVTESYILLGET